MGAKVVDERIEEREERSGERGGRGGGRGGSRGDLGRKGGLGGGCDLGVFLRWEVSKGERERKSKKRLDGENGAFGRKNHFPMLSHLGLRVKKENKKNLEGNK